MFQSTVQEHAYESCPLVWSEEDKHWRTELSPGGIARTPAFQTSLPASLISLERHTDPYT